MPSSHSATVTALAAAVGFQEGFGGSVFATALVLACVVWSPLCIYLWLANEKYKYTLIDISLKLVLL